MKKIPCPSCREPNFDTDIVCWKCGEPLRQLDGPDACQPSQTVQMDVSALRPSGGAGVVRAPASRSELVLAMVIAAVAGALVSMLLNIPFILWIKASCIPYSEAIPFVRWMTVAGAVAGAVSVTGRYGVVAGFLVYEAGYIAILVYAEMASITMPPKLGWKLEYDPHGFYYPGAGLICSYLGLVSARLGFRCLRRSPSLPTLSRSATYAEQERLDAFPMAALLLLLAFAHDAWWYAEAIQEPASRPRSVVMGYCEAMASSREGDLSLVQPMLTPRLARTVAHDPSMRSALNPNGILSLPEVARQITQRNVLSSEDVDPAYGMGEVRIVVKRSTGRIHLDFKLALSKGRWRIANPPKCWQETRQNTPFTIPSR